MDIKQQYEKLSLKQKELFQERASIKEFDAGYDRKLAEYEAMKEVLSDTLQDTR